MTWRWWAVLALIGASGCDDVVDRPDAGVTDPAGRLITQSGVISRGDDLGTSVSVSADGALLAVGAPGTEVERGGDELPIDNAGTVYVFERAGEGWSMQAQVTAPQPQRGDRFGSSVSLGAGDILVVGAPGDNALGDGTGAVFVFARSGSEWTPMP